MPSPSPRKRTPDEEENEIRQRDTKRRRAATDDNTTTSSTTSRTRTRRPPDDGDMHHQHRKSRRKRKHEEPSARSRRRGGSSAGTPPDDDVYSGPSSEPTMTPDTAFREALFDALADDEGAAYWEKIYSQPIHIYPRPSRTHPHTGVVEQISDDDYVKHVLQQMFKRTYDGYLDEVVQERARQREQHAEEAAAAAQEQAEQAEQARQNRRNRRNAEETRRVEEEIARTLRRGEERRKKKADKAAFAKYSARWQDWDGAPETIPWPTQRGDPKAITESSVRTFFLRGLDIKALGNAQFNAKLKEDRVRWHPDKMEQRLGGRGKANESVMADITMVFQIIDALYNDTRK